MSIKYELQPLHANVTGSCFPLTFHFKTGRTKKIIVDCGLLQEDECNENLNNLFFLFLLKMSIMLF